MTEIDGNPNGKVKHSWHVWLWRMACDHWPALLVLAIPILAALVSQPFRSELGKDLKGVDWWATNLIQFAVFTVGASVLVDFGQKRRERREREPYENRTIQLTGITGVNPRQQVIHWSDAKKFHENKFEYWKFIKSSVSTTCLIQTIDAEDARSRGWLKDSSDNIVIDFSAMCDEDIIRWQVPELPTTWEWVLPPTGNKPAKRRVNPTV